MAEQINYWTRLGMHLDGSTTAESRRVQAAITGDGQFSALTDSERSVAHASVDAELATRAAAARFGPDARRAGQVTVSMVDDRIFVEIAPEQSRPALSALA